MAGEALAKIRRKTKQLQKGGMSYKAAQKKAGQLYRQGKISGRTPPKKKAATRKHSSTSRRSHKIAGSGVVTIAGIRDQGLNLKLEKTRDEVHEELGWLLAAQRTAQTKKEKRALQPKIAVLSKLLRALQGGK